MNLEYLIKFNRDNEWKMEKHHFHEKIEILLSLTDAGTFFANGKLFPLKRGSIIVSENTVLHRTIANDCETYERYVIHFTKQTLKKISTKQSNIFSILGNDIQCIQLKESEISYFVDTLEKCKNMDCSDFGCDLRKDMFFIEILIKVCELIETKDKINSIENSTTNKLSPIVEYINDHLNEDLNLDVLAEHFYLSKYHLSRIFKASTGFTIIEYIINCRVLKARELLRNGHNVQNAGELAGFRNNAHFIRTFGKISGVTPGQYMRKYKDSKKE